MTAVEHTTINAIYLLIHKQSLFLHIFYVNYTSFMNDCDARIEDRSMTW